MTTTRHVICGRATEKHTGHRPQHAGARCKATRPMHPMTRCWRRSRTERCSHLVGVDATRPHVKGDGQRVEGGGARQRPQRQRQAGRPHLRPAGPVCCTAQGRRCPTEASSKAVAAASPHSRSRSVGSQHTKQPVKCCRLPAGGSSAERAGAPPLPCLPPSCC